MARVQFFFYSKKPKEKNEKLCWKTSNDPLLSELHQLYPFHLLSRVLRVITATTSTRPWRLNRLFFHHVKIFVDFSSLSWLRDKIERRNIVRRHIRIYKDQSRELSNSPDVSSFTLDCVSNFATFRPLRNFFPLGAWSFIISFIVSFWLFSLSCKYVKQDAYRKVCWCCFFNSLDSSL